jgi:hypothetical protein
VVLFDLRFEASTEVRCPNPEPYLTTGGVGVPKYTNRATYAQYTKQSHRFSWGCVGAVTVKAAAGA